MSDNMDAAGLSAAATTTSTKRDDEGEVRYNDRCNEGSAGVTFDAESQKPQNGPSNPNGDAASQTKMRSKTEGGQQTDDADEGAISETRDDDSVASIESIQTIIRRKLFGITEPPKGKKKKATKKSNPSNIKLEIEKNKSTGKQHDESSKSSCVQEVSPPVLDKPVTKSFTKARKGGRAVDESSSSSVTLPKVKSTRASRKRDRAIDESSSSSVTLPKVKSTRTSRKRDRAVDESSSSSVTLPKLKSTRSSSRVSGRPDEFDPSAWLAPVRPKVVSTQKEPEEDDSTESDDQTVEKEEPCEFRLGEPLVQDTDVFASYELLLFSQFNLCRYSCNKDFLFRKQQLHMKENYPGLECKYCLPHLGRRFFYKQKDTMISHILDLEKHLMRCPGCPATIQEQIRGAKLNGPKERKILRAKSESTKSDLSRFSTREYVEIMWNRLRSVVDMIEEQEDDNTDMKELERSVSIETKPDTILAERVDRTMDAGEERKTDTSSNSSSSKTKVDSKSTNDEESKQAMYPLVDLKADITATYDLVIFAQVQYCYFDPSVDNIKIFRKIKAGHPGFECKYCPSASSRRRFFYKTMQNLCTHVSNIDKHLLQCKGVPQTIKDQIENSRGIQEKERNALRLRAGYQPGYGKNRFTKKEMTIAVWDRLHAIPRPDIKDAPVVKRKNKWKVVTEEIPMNYVKHPKPESICLLHPSDVSMKYYLLIMSQFDFCQFDPSVDKGGCRNKFLQKNTPGLQCRNCGSGKKKSFFHLTLENMYGHGGNIERHVVICKGTPKTLQSEIAKAKLTIDQEQSDFRVSLGLDQWTGRDRFTRKEIYSTMWNRMVAAATGGGDTK